MNEGEGMSRDHDCGGDAAAYALGALDPTEAEIFRRHLEECAVCRDEVEALGGVVQALPMAAPQQPMPRGLRRRVVRAVRQEAGLRADPPVRRPSEWFGSRAVLVATASVALLAADGELPDLPVEAPLPEDVERVRITFAQASSARSRLARTVGLLASHASAAAAVYAFEHAGLALITAPGEREFSLEPR